MSYPGTRESAKADAKAADMQIDGLEPSATSPVRDGGSLLDAGGAPMPNGPHEFTTERKRHGWVGNQGAPRREYPTEGVSGKK
jgi:hypothetical protein